MGLQTSTTIDGSPELVWAVMTDWSKSGYWLGVEGLRPVNKNAKLQAGSRLNFDARGTQSITITRWEPGRAFTLETVQAGVTTVHRYTLMPEGAATKVTLAAECSATNPVWKLLLPLLNLALSRSDRRQLPALKQLTQVMVAVAEREADQLARAATKQEPAETR